MTSNTTGHHDPAELGELERAVLELIWAHGVQSADEVRSHLHAQGRTLKESTVRTVLKRLEAKGYLKHSLKERTFLYEPKASRQAVAGRAAQRIVDWFCGGSVETLLAGMVDSAVLDRKELQRLAERIAAAKKGKGHEQ
jgi:predicted transcriptional regulator